MCTLRNVSYKVDVEVDRNVYLDAVRVPVKRTNNSPQIASRDINQPINVDADDSDTVDGDDKNNKNKVIRLFFSKRRIMFFLKIIFFCVLISEELLYIFTEIFSCDTSELLAGLMRLLSPSNENTLFKSFSLFSCCLTSKSVSDET